MRNDNLTWTSHKDGVAEVGLNTGVTVKDAILRLAEYEHGERTRTYLYKDKTYYPHSRKTLTNGKI